MASQDKDITETLTEITEGLSQSLQSAIGKTLNQHLDFFLTRLLQETEFYKKVTSDMRIGLKKIYDFMPTDDPNIPQESYSGRLFSEANTRLNQVIDETEKATNSIMEIVEKNLAKNPDAELNNDLSEILTLLSFQDLTGQRIKLAIKALKETESTLLELYLSSGLLIKAYSATPEENIEKLEKETKTHVDKLTQQIIGSELKGPNSNSNQADIDALLAQFDL